MSSRRRNIDNVSDPPMAPPPKARRMAAVAVVAAEEEKESGRERLKRLRKEIAGRVWIPETWGKESLLKDWIVGGGGGSPSSALESSLAPNCVMPAREALVDECRRRRARKEVSV